MNIVFEQSERVKEESPIFVYENNYEEVFIGDRENFFICLGPYEAILFAKEVIKVANKIKRENE